MKLLFCEKCWDVFKLDYEVRSCKCGLVKGYYEQNGHNAVSNGKGISMAMDNRYVGFRILQMQELNKVKPRGKETGMADYDNYYTDCAIPFWVRPNEGIGNPRSIVKEDL